MATQIQSEQMNMFQTTEDHVETNSAVFFAIPGFKDRYLLFTGSLKQIFETNKELSADGSGTSSVLKQLRQKMIDSTYSLSSKITAYALQTKNQTLMNEINFTRTDLKACTYQNLVSLGELTLNRATALKTELVAYKVTEDMLDDYETLLFGCRNSIPSVRENINKKASSGNSMSQMISNNLALLGEMDILAAVISESNPVIYKDYLKSRKVLKSPSRRQVVIGKVTLTGGTIPVKGASINFYLITDKLKSQTATNNGATTAEKPVLTKTSASQGGFKVDSLPEGMYRVEVAKTGFQKQVLTVAISNSETTRIVVEMMSVE